MTKSHLNHQHLQRKKLWQCRLHLHLHTTALTTQSSTQHLCLHHLQHLWVRHLQHMYYITNSIIHCFKPWTVAGFRDTVSDAEAGDWGASPSPAKWYFIGIVVVSSLEMWAETWDHLRLIRVRWVVIRKVSLSWFRGDLLKLLAKSAGQPCVRCLPCLSWLPCLTL